MGYMQWKTAVWSTKIHQLCCKSGKQWEIFKTRPRHPSLWSRVFFTRGQLIDVFKYVNRFNNVSPIGLFDYDFYDRTRNNGKKIIVKQFNTSYITAFFPHQHYNNLECPTIWYSQQWDSKHIQEQPGCTLGRQSTRCAGQLVTDWCSQPSMDSGRTIFEPAIFEPALNLHGSEQTVTPLGT